MDPKADNGLEDLTEKVLASYDAEERTERIGRTFLPSREKIVAILEELRQVLFPGFFGQQDLTRQNVRYRVGSLLSKLADDLEDQLCHCLCSEKPQRDCPAECRRAKDLVAGFLKALPEVRRKLALDAQAAYDGDPAAKSIDEIIYSYPGFYAVTVYRLAHVLVELGVPLMPRIMSEHAHSVTGCDIHPGAKIGDSFFVDHATGVVIGETSELGNNVKIYQGVTLGALSFPKDERGRVIKGLKRHPTIEDNVTIYANATILGGQTVVGKEAVIGGNTWVTASVPSGARVLTESPIQVKNKPAK